MYVYICIYIYIYMCVCVYIYIYIYIQIFEFNLVLTQLTGRRRIGVYKILPLPILYSIYRNKGGSGGYTILRTSAGDGTGRGVPPHRGCLQIVVLIRVQKSRHKTISCKG